MKHRTRLNRRSRIKRHLRIWKVYISIAIIAGVVGYIILLGTMQFAKQLFNITAHAPTHKVYAQEKIATESTKVKPTPTEHDEIVAYIKEVFGEDSDKAFKVLSCENHALNPNAVNTAGNVPAGSRDLGIFQINEYWQRTQGKFLLNWKINVLVAHQIFTDNGNTFERWTCGRKLGV